MPVTREEFLREAVEYMWHHPSPELLAAGLSTEGLTPEQIWDRIPPEVRLRGISPEQRLQGISPEQVLQVITPEHILQGMTPEVRDRFRRLFDVSPSSESEGEQTELPSPK